MTKVRVAGVAILATLAGVAAIAAALVTRVPAPNTALPAPRFVDETQVSGLQHVYDGQFAFATGGGVAAFDCTGDGKPELYVAGGSNAAALYRNDSPTGAALRFSRIANPSTDLGSVVGAYPLDIDGDGNIDLAVLRAGGNVMLRGLGDCRFEQANERWSFDGGSSLSTSFSATWEDGDRLPTLAVGNYLKLDAGGETTLTCDTNTLQRPTGDGSKYAPAVGLEPGYCALSMLFSDWDRSGRRDLRVSNDRQYYTDGEEQLFRVEPGQSPSAYTAADGWRSLQIWGMGIASYDVTGDGLPDYFLTSQADNKLQTLAGDASTPGFRDIALKAGVTAAQPFAGGDALPSTAWHPQFEDVNNDGFVDLFVSKGNVDQQPGYARMDPSNLLIGQPDGTFREGAADAGVMNYARGRGAAVVDLNLDGLLDLVEVNYHDATRVWRNVGSGDPSMPRQMGNWLALTLRQQTPNRDGIGAWIEVRVGDRILRREVTVGGGHAGGQRGWIHFGLGSANEADVRVQWPDGELGPWQRARGGAFGIVARDAGGIVPVHVAGG